MFKKIVLGVLAILIVLVVVLVVLIAMQPEDFRVERKATMAAPPDAVFAQVNDFHKWEAWSPWEKLDPNMKRTFEGSESGPGAIYKWAGNDKVGEGQMKILETKPNESVKIKLDFIKPFESTSTTDFTFKGDGKETLVTWTMYGKHNFMSKAMCLIKSMDSMVGPDFEKGLASMKTIVEKK